MRRKDREITDKTEIIKIIDKCEVCRLGLSDYNVPYIIPMNYGYKYENDILTLYFHCAKEGKKLDIIGRNPRACFEMDCSHKLIIAEEAWHYTMEYESVVGEGEIHLCDDVEDKVEGLNLLMEKYEKNKKITFPDHIIDSVAILKLEVSEFTGKRSKRNNS